MYNRYSYHNRKAKECGKIARKIGVGLITIFLFFLLIYSVDSLIYLGKIYPNVFALHREIGGLKRDEIYHTLQPVIEEMLSSPVQIRYGRLQWNIVPRDILGATLDVEELTNDSYAICRRGSLLRRIRERIFLLRNSYQIPTNLNLGKKALNTFYIQLQEKIERPPRDASLLQGRVISARDGIIIDQEQLSKEIENTIIANADHADTSYTLKTIYIPVHYQKPELSTTEILAEIGVFEIISSYETSLNGKQENSIYNIEKAAEELNGIIVKPGEVFSFNRLIGRADKEEGYKESTIIVNGQFVNGYGGGVCQVSTTLYNAALLADLPIRERYNHSIYGEATSYVPQGRDAAVFYGYKDLKFSNSLDHQIVIFSEFTSDFLIISIWGEKKLDKEIRVITQDLKTYDYEVVEIKRDSSAKAVQDILQEGTPGYTVKTYRAVKDSTGERIEFISEDRYASIPRKIIID